MEALSNEKLKLLREKGILGEDEVAYKSGDIFLAESVITKKRRILEQVEQLVKNNSQLLKG